MPIERNSRCFNVRQQKGFCRENFLKDFPRENRKLNDENCNRFSMHKNFPNGVITYEVFYAKNEKEFSWQKFPWQKQQKIWCMCRKKLLQKNALRYPCRGSREFHLHLYANITFLMNLALDRMVIGNDLGHTAWNRMLLKGMGRK